jgi:putative inorganic carbon (HCO3(-)) transporter
MLPVDPIVALPLLLLVAVVGMVVVAVRPNVVTYAVVAILYSNFAANAVKLHGLPYVVGAFFPLLLVIPLAHEVFLRRRPIVVTPALGFIFAFLIVQVVGGLISVDQATSWDSIKKFAVEGFGLFLVLTNVIRTRETLMRVIVLVLSVGAVIGALSLYQTVTETYDEEFFGFAQVSEAAFKTGEVTLLGEEEQPRLAGMIGEQNRYAQTMIVLVPLGLFAAFAAQTRRRRVVLFSLTGLVTLGVVLSFSRGAGLGLGVMLAIMIALRYVRLRHLAGLAVAIALLFQLFPQYGTRLSTLQTLDSATSAQATQDGADGSIRSRATEMLSAGLMAVDHPLFGVGPDHYKTHYHEYADRVAILVENEGRQAHSLYLGIAAENGFLGLACFLGAIFVTIRQLARGRKRNLVADPVLANVATGFILALVAYLTTGLFLHLAFERYFWFLLALAAVAGRLAVEREPAEAEAPSPARARQDAAATASARPLAGSA